MQKTKALLRVRPFSKNVLLQNIVTSLLLEEV